MPWCPKCRNEYVEGIKVCADCKTALVESLEEGGRIPLIFGEKGQMERLKGFLTYSGFVTADISEDEKEGVYELYIEEAERQKAGAAVRVFLQQEAEAAGKAEGVFQEDAQEDTEVGKAQEGLGPGEKTGSSFYQDSAKQAADNRSSGYMLIVIGGLGLAAVGMIAAGIIRLPSGMINKYMLCFVMGALFLLFFIMGIVAVKSSKSLEKKAETESILLSEIKQWCGENISAGKVDEDLFWGEETGKEIKYFKRTDKMKKMIARQFMNLDDGFLDSFVDDYYQTVFEEEA